MQLTKFCVLFLLVSLSFFSFTTKSTSTTNETAGVFSCYINDKPFIVDSLTANIRKITGGEKQLSLSNERFVKFAFMNPSTKNIDLASSSIREAYIRYEDPASNSTGIPIKGYINITNFDEENKLLSGEFEMEIKVTVNNTTKILKVTKGKFSNIPIVFK